jgi:1-acyl-sn-glycerol-3-phosphate acyltransferase
MLQKVLCEYGQKARTAPIMKPFKNGAFKVAIENKIPILPISFPNNYLILEDSWGIFANNKPGVADIYFHKVIEPDSSHYQDLITLREKTKKIIQSKL